MSVEFFEITDVAPVKRAGRQGAGRRPEPNPLKSAVAGIVDQRDEDGLPRTKSAKFTLNDAQNETLKQRSGRVRRFLTRAGKELAEKNGLAEHYRINMTIQEFRDPDTKEFVKDASGRQVYEVIFWHRQSAVEIREGEGSEE